MFRRLSAVAAISAAALGLTLSGCDNSPSTASAEPAPQAAKAKREISTPAVMPNFTLKDQAGTGHELYKLAGAKAIVLVMQGVGCPIVQKLTPDIKTIAAAYESKGVKFLMINANNQDTPDMIAAEAKSFDIKIPILKDEGQKIAEPLGVIRTAEAFVIEPGTWKILYHGAINDRLTYGREKQKASNNYVTDVLDAELAGKPIPTAYQAADGCIIDFTARAAG